MAVLLAQLPGPINLRLVLSDLKFADILHDLVTAKGNRSGVPRVLAVDRNETRELAGTLHLEGASKDDAIAQIRAINRLVTVGTTLTLQSTGATNTVTLKVLPSRGASQPLDELFEIDGVPVLASCAFSFTCEPYAYGPETVVHFASVTAPTIVDINVPGDYPTPLNIYWVPGGARAGHLDRFAMGLLPDQTTMLSSLLHMPLAVNAIIHVGNPALCTDAWGHGLFTGQTIRILSGSTTPATAGTDQVVTVIDPSSFTIPVNITSGAAVAWSPWHGQNVSWVPDANAYGGDAWEQTATGWASLDVVDTDLPRGTYLPILRVGRTTGETPPEIAFSQTGGEVGREGLFESGASYGFHPWRMPLAAPALRWINEAGSVFQLSMRAGGAGGNARFNGLALLPTSWGWLLQSTVLSASYFWLDYDGVAYIQGIAQTSGITSGGMTAVGAQRLFFYIDGSGDGVTGELVVKVIPRYALWA